MAQVKRSYNKTSVGKAIWKQIMVTALLFGKAVVMAAKNYYKKVKAVENKVYRYLLGVAGYVAIAALRGEIGASRMETRVVEPKLIYAKEIKRSCQFFSYLQLEEKIIEIAAL